MMRCRLLLAGPLDGAWNMAVDEALLDSVIADPTRGPVLRWYQWREPTLSLGYFQPIADRAETLTDVPVVRRITGGGAILHDRELTYSLVVPTGCWPRSAPPEMIFDFHRFLADAIGPAAAPVERAAAPAAAGGEPFLCFQRRSRGDLAIGAHKVLGSAQRNRKGTLLQHGSILLEASPLTRDLPGLWDIGHRFEIEAIRAAVQQRLVAGWNWNLQSSSLSVSEEEMARQFHDSKFTDDSWTRRR